MSFDMSSDEVELKEVGSDIKNVPVAIIRDSAHRIFEAARGAGEFKPTVHDRRLIMATLYYPVDIGDDAAELKRNIALQAAPLLLDDEKFSAVLGQATTSVAGTDNVFESRKKLHNTLSIMANDAKRRNNLTQQHIIYQSMEALAGQKVTKVRHYFRETIDHSEAKRTDHANILLMLALKAKSKLDATGYLNQAKACYQQIPKNSGGIFADPATSYQYRAKSGIELIDTAWTNLTQDKPIRLTVEYNSQLVTTTVTPTYMDAEMKRTHSGDPLKWHEALSNLAVGIFAPAARAAARQPLVATAQASIPKVEASSPRTAAASSPITPS
ncbi:hypothetical protein BH10PSE19_BH10PSE19_16770 [soil metagenome]